MNKHTSFVMKPGEAAVRLRVQVAAKDAHAHTGRPQHCPSLACTARAGRATQCQPGSHRDGRSHAGGGRRRSGRPAPGRRPRSESESFMVEAAARACRNGRPLNSSINSNLKAAAAAARVTGFGHPGPQPPRRDRRRVSGVTTRPPGPRQTSRS